MHILEHVDLTPFNTLALPARARYFVRVDNLQNLHAAIDWAQQRQLPLLPLGGGSNVILRGEYAGLVLHIALRGKAIEHKSDYVEAAIAAGENWHELVQWTLQNHAFGLENLTLIPGTAGAAPIQNIGAYGVELSQFLHCVRGVRLDENRVVELSITECELAYRNSVFKHALRDNFIITEIVLRLRKDFVAAITYPALRNQLGAIDEIDAVQIERTVRAIRQSKLPDPAQWPNAGSFFKNPVINAEQLAQLKKQYPDLPYYFIDDRKDLYDGVKIPAAWLVDYCGWKGQRSGSMGVHAQQALVLIHYGGGDATALLALAARIQGDIRTRFNIDLELEPTIYGSSELAAY